jgi:tetratricopeptide (TPR) repeat protein
MTRIVTALFIVLLGLAIVYSAEENPNYKAGMAFYKQKKFLQSIGSFKKAIQEGYHNANVYFYLGNAYLFLNNKEYDTALDNYLIAYEFSGSADFQSTVMYQMGYAYYLKKDYTNSINYFDKSYALNSGLTQAYWAKGMAYYRLRDKESVIREWESYVALAPAGPQTPNIIKAIEILKATNFQFPPDGVDLLTMGTNSKSTNKSVQVTTKLPDIEGVLGDVKPGDKGKGEDSEMEEIEM